MISVPLQRFLGTLYITGCIGCSWFESGIVSPLMFKRLQKTVMFNLFLLSLIVLTVNTHIYGYIDGCVSCARARALFSGVYLVLTTAWKVSLSCRNRSREISGWKLVRDKIFIRFRATRKCIRYRNITIHLLD